MGIECRYCPEDALPMDMNIVNDDLTLTNVDVCWRHLELSLCENLPLDLLGEEVFIREWRMSSANAPRITEAAKDRDFKIVIRDE